MFDFDRISSVQAFIFASILGGSVSYLFCAQKSKNASKDKTAFSKKIKLYGDPRATCTRKVIQLLEERQYSWEFEIISLKDKDQKKPEYMAKHPFGKVPLIEVSDGFMLYESQAIVRYLDEVLPGNQFTPEDSEGRAIMNKWISIYDSYFRPPEKKILFERVLKKRHGRGECDEEAVNEALAELRPVLDVMESQLERTKYLAGTEFSLADLLFGPDFHVLVREVKDEITGRKNLSRWWSVCEERPAWKKTCEYMSLSKKASSLL